MTMSLLDQGKSNPTLLSPHTLRVSRWLVSFALSSLVDSLPLHY